MKQKFCNAMLGVFLLAVIFTGCSLFGIDDSGNSATSTSDGVTTATGDASASDQNDVEQALLGDDFFNQAMSDMLDEDESMMESSSMTTGLQFFSSNLTDTTLPIAEFHQRWRRHRTGLASINKSFEFGRNGDTNYRNVSITRNITGLLLVDTSRDAIKNPGNKSFTDTISHKWYFEKFPGRKWHVVKMSPREIKLADASKQKVYIDKIEVQKSGQIVFSVTSPDQMFIKADLPRFNRGDRVKVMATVRNISPNYNPDCLVFLHHFNVWGKIARVRLFDDGTHGDLYANDNVFTNTFYIHGPLIQHVVIDVLDSKCLQNQTEDDYNSNAWGLPYRVIN
ncbi:MAG: choice-of-anchor X domain-containing protein [bacterium]